MKVTKAKAGRKFIGSSADDSIGVGEFVEGTTLRVDDDGIAIIDTPDGPVEVYRVIEVPATVKWKNVH